MSSVSQPNSSVESSVESFQASKKIKSAASTTGSALKKGGSTVVSGAKKVGGWFGGWFKWIIYAVIAMAIIGGAGYAYKSFA